MATNNILPFQLDFDKSELRMTSYKTTITRTIGDIQTSETKKKEVPMIAAGATLHEILYCINEFHQAKKALNWTTGHKSFDNFPDIFEDPQDKNFWELTVNAEADRSNDAFRSCLNKYIAHKFSDNFRAYRQHQRFIRNIKKTKSLSVHQFVSLIQYHSVNILPFLPGAPNINAFAQFSPADLKDIIFNAMPDEWIYEFDTKHDVEDATLSEIVRFMEKLYYKSERTKSSNKNSNNNNRNGNGGNNNSSGRNSTKGRRNGGGRNHGRNRNNNDSDGESRRKNNRNKKGNNNRNGRIRQDDDCPLPGHRGHTWGECYSNANNPNRPNFNGNGNRNNDGNTRYNNNNGNNGRDNHDKEREQ